MRRTLGDAGGSIWDSITALFETAYNNVSNALEQEFGSDAPGIPGSNLGPEDSSIYGPIQPGTDPYPLQSYFPSSGIVTPGATVSYPSSSSTDDSYDYSQPSSGQGLDPYTLLTVGENLASLASSPSWFQQATILPSATNGEVLAIGGIGILALILLARRR